LFASIGIFLIYYAAKPFIYHLTPLTVPPGTLKAINKLERAFL
jgi:hypothetical protein